MGRTIIAERTEINGLDNGPYPVRGPAVVTDGDQFPIERKIMALCRCGDRRRSRPATAPTRRLVAAAERAVGEEVDQGS